MKHRPIVDLTALPPAISPPTYKHYPGSWLLIHFISLAGGRYLHAQIFSYFGIIIADSWPELFIWLLPNRSG